MVVATSEAAATEVEFNGTHGEFREKKSEVRRFLVMRDQWSPTILGDFQWVSTVGVFRPEKKTRVKLKGKKTRGKAQTKEKMVNRGLTERKGFRLIRGGDDASGFCRSSVSL
ncbi:hypothetical protein U1Q18_002424 [Sarracenia purpurea var. burkii]